MVLLAAFIPGFITVYSGFFLSLHGRELGFQEDYKYRRAYSWCTTLHDVFCVTALIVFTLGTLKEICGCLTSVVQIRKIGT